MANPQNAAALRECSFFSGLSEEELEQLLQIAREVEYRGQEELFHEEDPAKDVLLITSGKVALVICVEGKGCRQIMEVKAGDLIGWSPLLGKRRLTDTAMALTSVKALAFDGEKLVAMCRENPQFGFEFMRRTANVLADRLSAVRWQLVDVYGSHLPELALESD